MLTYNYCNILIYKFKTLKAMEKKDLIEEKIKAKVKEAKELPPADIKLILLGDSAVGKSK
jgi:hypothetical protein